jgi:Tubulin-tyrosine ligase family
MQCEVQSSPVVELPSARCVNQTGDMLTCLRRGASTTNENREPPRGRCNRQISQRNLGCSTMDPYDDDENTVAGTGAANLLVIGCTSNDNEHHLCVGSDDQPLLELCGESHHDTALASIPGDLGMRLSGVSPGPGQWSYAHKFFSPSRDEQSLYEDDDEALQDDDDTEDDTQCDQLQQMQQSPRLDDYLTGRIPAPPSESSGTIKPKPPPPKLHESFHRSNDSDDTVQQLQRQQQQQQQSSWAAGRLVKAVRQSGIPMPSSMKITSQQLFTAISSNSSSAVDYPYYENDEFDCDDADDDQCDDNDALQDYKDNEEDDDIAVNNSSSKRRPSLAQIKHQQWLQELGDANRKAKALEEKKQRKAAKKRAAMQEALLLRARQRLQYDTETLPVNSDPTQHQQQLQPLYLKDTTAARTWRVETAANESEQLSAEEIEQRENDRVAAIAALRRKQKDSHKKYLQSLIDKRKEDEIAQLKEEERLKEVKERVKKTAEKQLQIYKATAASTTSDAVAPISGVQVVQSHSTNDTSSGGIHRHGSGSGWSAVRAMKHATNSTNTTDSTSDSKNELAVLDTAELAAREQKDREDRRRAAELVKKARQQAQQYLQELQDKLAKADADECAAKQRAAKRAVLLRDKLAREAAAQKAAKLQEFEDGNTSTSNDQQTATNSTATTVKLGANELQASVARLTQKRRRSSSFSGVPSCSGNSSNSNTGATADSSTAARRSSTSSGSKQHQQHTTATSTSTSTVQIVQEEDIPAARDFADWKRKRGLTQDTKVFVMTGWYPCVKAALVARGWYQNHDRNSTFFDLRWSLQSNDTKAPPLQQWQLCNHFGRSAAITTKAGLLDSMKHLKWHVNADTDTVFPRGYNLNYESDLLSFVDDFKVTTAMNILKHVLLRVEGRQSSGTNSNSATANGSSKNAVKRSSATAECKAVADSKQYTADSSADDKSRDVTAQADSKQYDDAKCSSSVTDNSIDVNDSKLSNDDASTVIDNTAVTSPITHRSESKHDNNSTNANSNSDGNSTDDDYSSEHKSVFNDSDIDSDTGNNDGNASTSHSTVASCTKSIATLTLPEKHRLASARLRQWSPEGYDAVYINEAVLDAALSVCRKRCQRTHQHNSHNSTSNSSSTATALEDTVNSTADANSSEPIDDPQPDEPLVTDLQWELLCLASLTKQTKTADPEYSGMYAKHRLPETAPTLLNAAMLQRNSSSSSSGNSGDVRDTVMLDTREAAKRRQEQLQSKQAFQKALAARAAAKLAVQQDIVAVGRARLNTIKSVLAAVKSRHIQYDIDGGCFGQNVWIVKPAAKSRGRGIACFADITPLLEYTESLQQQHRNGTTSSSSAGLSQWVVQKYMENPLLIARRKFDIRQWVLVTDWNPLTVYFYEDCYLRFGVEEYTTCSKSLANQYVHLVNNSIGKTSEKFGRVSVAENGVQILQHMWNVSAFDKYLTDIGQPGAWCNSIKPTMKDIVKWSLMCGQEAVEHRKNSWELYGYDFMIDDGYKPWLIEINSSPACDYSTSVTESFVQRALLDVIKVTIDSRDTAAATTAGSSDAQLAATVDTGMWSLIHKGVHMQTPVASFGVDMTLKGTKMQHRRPSQKLT